MHGTECCGNCSAVCALIGMLIISCATENTEWDAWPRVDTEHRLKEAVGPFHANINLTIKTLSIHIYNKINLKCTVSLMSIFWYSCKCMFVLATMGKHNNQNMTFWRKSMSSNLTCYQEGLLYQYANQSCTLCLMTFIKMTYQQLAWKLHFFVSIFTFRGPEGEKVKVVKVILPQCVHFNAALVARKYVHGLQESCLSLISKNKMCRKGSKQTTLQICLSLHLALRETVPWCLHCLCFKHYVLCTRRPPREGAVSMASLLYWTVYTGEQQGRWREDKMW